MLDVMNSVISEARSTPKENGPLTGCALSVDFLIDLSSSDKAVDSGFQEYTKLPPSTPVCPSPYCTLHDIFAAF